MSNTTLLTPSRPFPPDAEKIVCDLENPNHCSYWVMGSKEFQISSEAWLLVN